MAPQVAYPKLLFHFKSIYLIIEEMLKSEGLMLLFPYKSI